MVRLVLFDIDGTLVHTGRAGSRAFGKAIASEFKAPETVEQIRFGGRTDLSLSRELFGLIHPGHAGQFPAVFRALRFLARPPCRTTPTEKFAAA